MNRLLLLALLASTISCFGQAESPATSPAEPAHAPPPASVQASLDRLTQANRDLLDLLKRQQAVLEDIQYDRRLQSRQILSLEDRLEETLLENSQLQNKISNLSSAAAAPQGGTAPGTSLPPLATSGQLAVEPPPPPPSTYLPPPDSEGAAGTKSWHRLFTLSGTDGKNSDLFAIQGRNWRVLWHNLDKPGKAYANTSALFINAFPKDDTIPQKVCSKLGSGGDSTELLGPGNYYLKIEASGGNWELAVEDFR